MRKSLAGKEGKFQNGTEYTRKSLKGKEGKVSIFSRIKTFSKKNKEREREKRNERET